jgi:hypothetical protein
MVGGVQQCGKPISPLPTVQGMHDLREDRGAPNMVVWMLRLSSDQRRARRAEGGVILDKPLSSMF